jgi:FMN phosphatase YigB (HAD superfamily)
MSLTILFDLDDTLLQTNMGNFIPAYFKALGDHMAHLVPAGALTNQLSKAVRAMENNRDPGKTLKSVFDQRFYGPLGGSEPAWRDVLEDFYRTTFPKLKPITRKKPAARELVQWCLSQGFTLAVTTNPLFPKTATHQRMAWAGLDPEDFLFVSTYEDFHFTKPHLAYYAEALGRLGWPEGPVIMVGDNPTHDLEPVERLGYAAFWVNPQVQDPDRPHGPLRAVQAYLKTIQNREQTPPGLQERPEVWEAILRSSPAVLAAWVGSLPQSAQRKRPAQHEWSLVEVFWHLADMEKEVALPQWEQLLTDPDQPLRPTNTEDWAETRDYRSRDLQPALEQFLHARLESLDRIQELQARDILEKTIRHPVFAGVKIRELVQFAARHDRIHLQQAGSLLDIYKNN